MRESDLRAREQEIQRPRQEQLRQQEAGLTSSQHNLRQARFESPFDGIVTRRNVEEGENVVTGTMNNAGTVLLTIADMSVIEAEVEVDETDIPLVRMGQFAKVTIDAIDGRTFTGRVTEIGNSPIQAAGAAVGGARTATNFKVVVTLEGEISEVRPGFTCTAEITTAKRAQVVAVPIQALTVRELLYDEKGHVIREPRPPKPRLPVRADRDAAGVRVDVNTSSSRVRSARKPKACSSCATGRRNSCRSRSALPASAISKSPAGSRTATVSSPARSTRCATCTTVIS